MWGFADPWVLLLLPAPLLVWLWAPPRPLAALAALRVPETVAATLARHAAAGQAAPLRLVLPWLCWAGLVLAGAGPQVTLPVALLPTSGREIYLVIDISGSMRRTDFLLAGKLTNRLEAVQAVAADFVARRAGDRIGLVFFAEQSYVAAPASFDLGPVRQALAEARIGVVGTSTAIGDGLGLALKRLRESDAAARVAILLSDGSNTAGRVKPEEAARLARDLAIRVHAIGLGTDDKVEGPGAGADEVDYAALELVARTSGGEAFRVRTTAELVRVYEAIETLEASGAVAPPAAVARALWPYPAGLAFLSALALAWRGGGGA